MYLLSASLGPSTMPSVKVSVERGCSSPSVCSSGGSVKPTESCNHRLSQATGRKAAWGLAYRELPTPTALGEGRGRLRCDDVGRCGRVRVRACVACVCRDQHAQGPVMGAWHEARGERRAVWRAEAKRRPQAATEGARDLVSL